MVSLVTTLPKEGTATEQEVEDWLERLAERRPAEDVALLRQAVQMARVAHTGEGAPDGFDKFLSLLHTADTLDSLKLEI